MKKLIIIFMTACLLAGCSTESPIVKDEDQQSFVGTMTKYLNALYVTGDIKDLTETKDMDYYGRYGKNFLKFLVASRRIYKAKEILVSDVAVLNKYCNSYYICVHFDYLREGLKGYCSEFECFILRYIKKRARYEIMAIQKDYKYINFKKISGEGNKTVQKKYNKELHKFWDRAESSYYPKGYKDYWDYRDKIIDKRYSYYMKYCVQASEGKSFPALVK